MSRIIRTENFDNLFIQNKNWLRSQKFLYNTSQLAAYPFWLGPVTMILASLIFQFWNPVRKWDTRVISVTNNVNC